MLEPSQISKLKLNQSSVSIDEYSNPYHSKCASVVAPRCEHDMAGTFHSHPRRDCTLHFEREIVKSLILTIAQNQQLCVYFRTTPLQRVLLFNKICSGEYKQPPVRHESVTKPLFDISNSNCRLGISF